MTTPLISVARRPRQVGLRRLALSRWWIAFSLTAVAGIALRVLTYRSAMGVPNSDEAVVGLMVSHAEHGDLTTFFWGGAYGGPQEVLLTVPLFWVFGSSWLALRIVPIALSALAALLVWRVGRRTIGEPAASVAAGIYWIWPPFVIFQLTQMQSFYAANVVYCAFVVLLALRIVERPDLARVGLLGLVLGLAFWQTPQIVPIAVPVVAWTVWKEPRSLRHLWLAAVGAVVGALPWIVWNVQHDWKSLDVHGGFATYWRSLRLLVSPLMPMTIGLRAPFSASLFLPPTALTYLIYVCLAGLFVYGAIRTRRRDTSILFFVAATFPFVYALARMTTYITAWPQYTVVLTPVLALLFAQVATRYVRAVALLALMLAVSAVALHRMDDWFHLPQPLPAVPRDFNPLISTLDRLHVDRVYASYWIAYVLDFDSHERIIAVENELESVRFVDGRAVPPPDPNVRYETYQRDVQAGRPGFVFFRRNIRTFSIVAELARHGYRRHDVGRFVVYVPGTTG